MILPDINLLVYSVDATSPFHAVTRRWWDDALSSSEAVGLCYPSVLGFVRLTTHRNVFESPLEVDTALAIVQSWLAQPNVTLLTATARHRPILAELLRTARGANLTTDAHLAAHAIEHGYTLHSIDRDFGRFEGLHGRTLCQRSDDRETATLTWQPETDEIRKRRLAALSLGGADRVARQHAQGKKTARERLDLLLDSGSFTELGLLATHQSQRPEMQGVRTAADGFIMGYGLLDGREILVGAEDFTVMGGSVGTTGLLKRERLLELAHQNRVPAVWLFDGSGARALEYVRAGWVGGPHFALMSKLSGIVPQVAAAMGPCAGDPALMAPLADFVVMVKGTSMLAAGGPPVVEAAIGEKVSKEELGGSSVHCYVSGVADNEADSDESCLRMIRAYLAYFPTNVWSRPPRVATGDDPERRDQELLSIVPRDRKRPYDVQRVIRHLVDRGTVFEIKPGYSRSLVTCLARMDGEVVGVVASQPLHLAGMIDGAAADKMTHFIQLCDAFHIPLIFLSDVPGFMTGKISEREGTLRRGLRVAYALAFSTVPKVSVVLRKAYGMGAVAMCGHKSGQVLTLVWPSGEFGALPVGGGVSAGHKSAIETADDPESKRAALEDYYQQFGGAFSTAETFNFDDLIDPRDTRPLIIRALRAARAGATAPLGPKMRHGIMP